MTKTNSNSALAAHLSGSTLASAADQFDLLAVPLRIQILTLVAVKHRRIRDLVPITGISKATLASHFKRLILAGAIGCYRSGRDCWYTIEPIGLRLMEAIREVAEDPGVEQNNEKI